MQRMSSRGLAAVASVLLAALLVPSTAGAVLERVGPNSPTNFLPTWYQDTTGITLEFCTPLDPAELSGGWCLLLPGDIPGDTVPEIFPNAFGGEHFYWASEVTGDWTYQPAVGGPVTSRVVFVQAIEAAFLGDIGPGLGSVFGRVRIRVDDLPLTGVYRFYTPWGIKEVAGVAGGRIFDTEDIGTACAPFQYDCALQTSIGPFLLPSNSPGGAELPPVAGPVPGKLYLSDPARVGPVTGSPLVGDYTIGGQQVNPNVFAIEAPDGQLIFLSHDFSMMGRIYGDVIPSRVAVDRASYGHSVSDAVSVDVYATGEPTLQPRLPGGALTPPAFPALELFSSPCGGTPDGDGGILPPFTAPSGGSIPMPRFGTSYYGHSTPAAVPAGVCLVDLNARNAQGTVEPRYTNWLLADQVFISEAFYDPANGGSLNVFATSSDDFAPPLLSVGAFGELAANVPLASGAAVITPLAAPPATVRVLSQEGGSNTAQVKIGRRPATGVTLSADLPSPQFTGTNVVFTAAGQGSAGYQYRFSMSTNGGPFLVVQPYGADATFTLQGSSTLPGSYIVVASVRTTTTVDADATSAQVPITIVKRPASGVTLSANLSSPQPKGTAITFTAAGQGSSDYQYRFLLSTNNGTTFTVVQNYGTTTTWTLPATVAAGNYLVQVEVRTSTLVARDAVSDNFPFAIATVPATGVTLTSSLPSPQLKGTAVTFTAAGQGSSGYQYQFFLSTNAGLTWFLASGWSSFASYTLPSTAAAGSYLIRAEVRTSTLVARDAVSADFAFSITLPQATGVAVTADLTSPQTRGTAVTFTAAGQGSSGYQYRFFLSSNGGSTWMLVQNWSTFPSYTLPASVAAGNYLVQAEVRTSTLTGADATSASFPFQIIP